MSSYFFVECFVLLKQQRFPELLVHRLLTSRSQVILPAALVYLLTLMHIVNLLFFQGFHVLANFTYIPAYGWMAVLAFYFLKEQLEDVNMVPFNSLITWFAVATLIDIAGSLPILSVLGWSGFISQEIAFHLYDLVTWLYAFWFFIILTGLLWTKTTLRSAFYSR